RTCSIYSYSPHFRGAILVASVHFYEATETRRHREGVFLRVSVSPCLLPPRSAQFLLQRLVLLLLRVGQDAEQLPLEFGVEFGGLAADGAGLGVGLAHGQRILVPPGLL